MPRRPAVVPLFCISHGPDLGACAGAMTEKRTKARSEVAALLVDVFKSKPSQIKRMRNLRLIVDRIYGIGVWRVCGKSPDLPRAHINDHAAIKLFAAVGCAQHLGPG